MIIYPMLEKIYPDLDLKNELTAEALVLTRLPYAQKPPIAMGNKQSAITVYAAFTPLHIGTREGCFRVDGMVACRSGKKSHSANN